MKERNPEIQTITVAKKYPNVLEVKITAYRPTALLETTNGFVALAGDGHILYKTKDDNKRLPKIRFYQKFNSDTITAGLDVSYKEIKDSLTFLTTIEDLGLMVDRVDINSTGVILCNLKDKIIIFTSEGDIKQQIYWLQTLVRQFKIEGKEFKSLDLRFDKPIVKFE